MMVVKKIYIIKYGLFLDVRTIKTRDVILRIFPDIIIEIINPISESKYSKNNVINYLSSWKKILNLIKGERDESIFWSCDLTSGVPLFLFSYFFKLRFVFDVYDEFDLSFKNDFFSNGLKLLESYVSRRSLVTIRVEEYRRRSASDLIVRNLPTKEFITNYVISKNEKNWRPIVVFSGQLLVSRGFNLCLDLARMYPDLYIVVFGHLNKEKIELPSNVFYFGRIDQSRVYNFYKYSKAVIALYDPAIKINLLAASNKFYEANAFSNLLIVNREIKYSILNSKDVNIISVDYSSDIKNLKNLHNELISKNFIQNTNDFLTTSFDDELILVLNRIGLLQYKHI